jgi:hypothetical protein
VGIVTSIGLPLHVPILIRSLAQSMAFLAEGDLPLGFDLDFLMLLDSDLAEQNGFTRLVETYEHSWWRARKPRDLDLAEILNSSTIVNCLDVHEGQFNKTFQMSSAHLAENPFGQPSTSSSGNVADKPFGQSSPSTAPESFPDDTLQCQNCDQYAGILSDTLQDLLGIHNVATTMGTNYDIQWDMDMRRASTFHLLYEAAVLKETADVPSASQVSMLHGNAIKNVADSANRELVRLQALSPSSHKWTWGERLTNDEVLSLHRCGSRKHSGYEISLKDGKRVGEYSPNPSMPETSHAHSDFFSRPSSSALRPLIPEHSLPEIPYFKKRQNLSFDPLRKIRRQHIPVSSFTADLTRENVKGLSDVMPFDGDTTSNIENLLVRVEEEWKSGTDEEGEVSAHDVADEWKSDSDIQDKSADIENVWNTGSDNNEGTDDVANVWESGSDDNNDKDPTNPSDVLPNASYGDVVVLPAQMADAVEPSASSTARLTQSNDTVADVADEWESDEDENKSPSQIQPSDRTSEVDWESASDEQPSANEIHSSPIRINSQVMVSPSRITIPCDNSYRLYGPDDFSNLQDHMFENKDSDSDSSY